MSIRPVKRLSTAQPTLEGAGVHLRRAFGFGVTEETDPFLLLDDFRNERPEDYLKGFPWHPHRGIETITYVLSGTVDHADSLGNRGSIAPGDVQWMTAGSGIVHQEMPHGDASGRMHGFQLWANLPSSLKMTAPRYQDIRSGDIASATDDDGTIARVICGELWGVRGPVDGIAADPQYVDVWVPPLKRKRIPVETTHHAFAYVFEGSGTFAGASEPFDAPTERVGDPDVPLEGHADRETGGRRGRAGDGASSAGTFAGGRSGGGSSEASSSAGGTSAGGHKAGGHGAGNRTLVLFDRGDEVVVRAGDNGVRFLLVSGRPLREPVAWYGPIVMNTEEELRRAWTELRDGTFLK